MSNFTFAPLAIPGPVLVRPRPFDDRGFMETYSREPFAAAGIAPDFVQDNQSLSVRSGTVRGLHYQTAPAAQAKLVRVLRGAIFDVVVDLRRGSPHYGRWCGTLLNADGAEQLFVPHGFAHGFCTLKPSTAVAYKVDAPYAPQCEGGLFWADPTLAIDWPVVARTATVSEKDAKLAGFAGFVSPFVYEGA